MSATQTDSHNITSLAMGLCQQHHDITAAQVEQQYHRHQASRQNLSKQRCLSQVTVLLNAPESSLLGWACHQTLLQAGGIVQQGRAGWPAAADDSSALQWHAQHTQQVETCLSVSPFVAALASSCSPSHLAERVQSVHQFQLGIPSKSDHLIHLLQLQTDGVEP
jgi:hypothetical protein